MSNGPIQGYQQVSHGQQWAHSRISAVPFMSNNGPIQGYRQVSHGQQWAHSWPSEAFLISNNGPIQQNWLTLYMGPLVHVSNISYQ
jgi:hypothetical protein